MRFILDVSRTLSRAAHPVPTGIDRVEMAYASWLLAHHPDSTAFAALHPIGRMGTLPRAETARFLAAVQARWAGDSDAPDARVIAGAARSLRNTLLLRGDLPTGSRLRPRRLRDAYLLMSHHHLDRPDIVQTAIRRRDAALICLVHDLIPIDFKEYARPAEPARHRRRMQTVADLADGIVVNSVATGQALRPWLAQVARPLPARPLPVLVAPLGVNPSDPGTGAPPFDGQPYFVFIGTIEPRKNHLLALHVWRRLVARMGSATPRLVLIGRRGWENEQVVDLIERCEDLKPVLTEHGSLTDRQTRTLMQHARALLLPSFAEGYGLPVAEALALGTPVLCSDLPALREVGGAVPDYLDPLDGLGWLEAVIDYAAPASPRRLAQAVRRAGWTPPAWDTHVSAAIDFARQIVEGLLF